VLVRRRRLAIVDLDGNRLAVHRALPDLSLPALTQHLDRRKRLTVVGSHKGAHGSSSSPGSTSVDYEDEVKGTPRDGAARQVIVCHHGGRVKVEIILN
jgi:hypothetical protein